jgi:uncharacterized protein YyaL (SSP411 family)
MANRLQYETSPYLLQHAHNPVDWYPWGEEAFERAKAEHKPVLVSIGYAACHWCHVMEHESFENPAVADFMNAHFICIKVDREEHPDVDHLYMDALQAMTGAGGWPLNMFVTPDKKPFYGGTYFPPEDRYGRSSWSNVLGALHRAWHEKPEEIKLQSEQMVQHLQQASQVSVTAPDAGAIDQGAAAVVAKNLLQQADKEEGGFGAAPKFPATGAIQYLLDYFHYHKEQQQADAEDALQQALLSLDKMIGGGIYDQVGGGFARYATDNAWLVPHFEKMLYDNALLITVLSNAYRITAKKRYREVIEATIAFCKKELGFEATGGFYCALDADSEGVEGKFYTWTWAQWQELMGDAHPALADYFGVVPEGNWEETNILNEAVPESVILERYNLGRETWEKLLRDARQKLLLRRAGRVRPATDDKLLLSWNALMNIALVDAGIALSWPAYIEDAAQHMDWMLATFDNGEGSLNHVAKNGIARIPGKLDDYAYLIKALCHLASVTGTEAYIVRAQALMQYCNTYFLHENGCFYYYSSIQQNDIPVRKVELYDGATPAANTVMMENLWLLGNLLEESGWMEQAEAMMHVMKQTVLRYPTSFAVWAVFLQRYQAGLKQLYIAGEAAHTALEAWQQHYYPEVTVMVLDKPESLLVSAQQKYRQGKTSYYLCAQFQCQAPVSTLEELMSLLRKH